jgi:hypothetical protein
MANDRWVAVLGIARSAHAARMVLSRLKDWIGQWYSGPEFSRGFRDRLIQRSDIL